MYSIDLDIEYRLKGIDSMLACIAQAKEYHKNVKQRFERGNATVKELGDSLEYINNLYYLLEIENRGLLTLVRDKKYPLEKVLKIVRSA